MELFQVKLEFCDRLAEPNQEFKKTGVPDSKQEAWLYPRKTVDAWCAVHPRFGAEMVANAAKLAIDTVIGQNVNLEEWQPVILSVEFIGHVRIEGRRLDSVG